MIRTNQQWVRSCSMLLDGVLAGLSLFLSVWIRFALIPGGRNGIPIWEYWLAAGALVPMHLLTGMGTGLYETDPCPAPEQRRNRRVMASLLDLIGLAVGLFLLKEPHFSRLALLIWLFTANLTAAAKDWAGTRLVRHLRGGAVRPRRILIAGGGENLERYLEAAACTPDLQDQVLGCVTDLPRREGPVRLGGLDDLPQLLDRLKPDAVVACPGAREQDRLPWIMKSCEQNGIKLSVVPVYVKEMPGCPQIDMIGDLPLIQMRRIPLDHVGSAFVKRTMDLVLAAALLILTSPLLLVTALGVKLSSPGPVIFAQKRVGRDRREFTMYKFRSMYLNSQENSGWSTPEDGRRTPFGALIRKCSIDELPQLVNVLRGDMSLVGPRPELPCFVEQFRKTVPHYMVKHQVRPGMTGWAQVHGLRGDTSIKERIRYDIYYIEHWSLAMDIRIMMLTPGKLVNRERMSGTQP